MSADYTDFADFGVRSKRWWGEAPARPQGHRREIRVCHDRLSLGLRKRRAVVYRVHLIDAVRVSRMPDLRSENQ